jgi:hypothetical protein
MGGTLTIRHQGSRDTSTASAWKVFLGRLVSGTLLGPEGTAVWLVPRTPTPVNFACLSGGGDGWLVVA